MIQKSMPPGVVAMAGNRFSLATNAERVCAEITPQQRAWSATVLQPITR
jgi:hypothetical protein